MTKAHFYYRSTHEHNAFKWFGRGFRNLNIKMNVRKTKQVWLLITVCSLTTVTFADPSEHFLNSVITQLKQNQDSQFPLHTRYRSLNDELFGTNSRSAEEFQNSEAQVRLRQPIHKTSKIIGNHSNFCHQSFLRECNQCLPFPPNYFVPRRIPFFSTTVYLLL